MQFSSEELSKPISDELPCGEDLEYDPAFQQMETLMQSSGEREVGGEVIPASGPDWKGVAQQAKDLFGRTRDLRVFVNAAMAGLNTVGLTQFHEVMVALNNCMEEYWEALHPVLDESDDFDPMMRMNILQNLSDYDNVRQGLEHSPLVELKGVGKFSFHDIELAEGRDQADEGEEVVDAAVIRGAFTDADPGLISDLADAITGSIDELQRTLDIWAEKTDNYESPELDVTAGVLTEILKAVSTYSPTVAEAAGEVDAEGDAAAAPGVASGAINNRGDVIKAIDRICEFYTANEPSSPVPILLRRAQGLVSKSFFEILEDIVPESLPQAHVVGGKQNPTQ
jgi:type VI secretion system protein ImpA